MSGEDDPDRRRLHRRQRARRARAPAPRSCASGSATSTVGIGLAQKRMRLVDRGQRRGIDHDEIGSLAQMREQPRHGAASPARHSELASGVKLDSSRSGERGSRRKQRLSGAVPAHRFDDAARHRAIAERARDRRARQIAVDQHDAPTGPRRGARKAERDGGLALLGRGGRDRDDARAARRARVQRSRASAR